MLEIPILFGLVSRLLFVPIFDSKFKRTGSSNPGFLRELSRTPFFTEIVSYGSRGIFVFLFEALGPVFLIFAALETALKIARYSAE